MTIPIISNYLEWYKENFVVCEAGNSEFGLIYEVFPPIFNKNNMGFSFYYQERTDRTVITDLGSTLKEISAMGFEETKNKIEYIQKICALNEVNFDQKTSEIYFEVMDSNQDIFNIKLQSYISALVEIDSLRNTLNPKNIAKIFLEDLKKRLTMKNIDFNPKPKPIRGNFDDYSFDFSVKRRSDYKEVFAKVYKEIDTNNTKQIGIRKELDIAQNNNSPMLVISFNQFIETSKTKKLEKNGVMFVSKETFYSENFIENNYKLKT